MIRPLLIGLLIINVLVILLLLLVGCSCHTYNRTVLRGETYSINPPHAVLDTPEMAQLTAQNSSIASGTQPWWLTRNDDRLGLRSGAADRSDSYTFVRTIDSQRSSNGRVHDSYNRTGYGYEYRSNSR